MPAAPAPAIMPPDWFVYILRCADSSLYTGITTDLARRLTEHNTGESGAKYTRARRPVELVYQERLPDRSAAAKRELRIRRMRRAGKEKLLVGGIMPMGSDAAAE
ncbi:MAG: GIY-YIG nuclease family protein [Gammaproteobacteria bacterium]